MAKFKFSQNSLRKLSQCHPDLQRIAHEMIKEMDITIVEGFRGEKAQNEAVRNGTSKLPWPRSKHNKKPALAFDAAPYPVRWPPPDAPADHPDQLRFVEMRKLMKAVAARLKIKVRFISWDFPHIELV